MGLVLGFYKLNQFVLLLLKKLGAHYFIKDKPKYY